MGWRGAKRGEEGVWKGGSVGGEARRGEGREKDDGERGKEEISKRL